LLGFAHRALGAPQRLGDWHAALVEPLHEVAELVAQTVLLVALVVAPLAVVARLALAGLPALTLLALLAALALLLLLAALPLALAQQLVLPARQPVELVHHLAALLVA